MVSFNNFDLNIFNDYKNMLFKSKKYCLIYLVLIFVFGLATINKKNFIHPEFTILTFILVAILGIFCIVFIFCMTVMKNCIKLHLL